MIYPSIAELTKNTGINRYTLAIATAKSARIITDEYVRQREYAEKLSLSKDADKSRSIGSLIRREYRDDKAVKLAVAGLYSGEFRILSPEEAEERRSREAAQAAVASTEAASTDDAVTAEASTDEEATASGAEATTDDEAVASPAGEVAANDETAPETPVEASVETED